MRTISDEDARLNALWMEHFAQPVPMLGAGDLVREVLSAHGVLLTPEVEGQGEGASRDCGDGT